MLIPQYRNLVVPRHTDLLLLMRSLLSIAIVVILLLSLQWVSNKNQEQFPTLYRLPKLHKRPYKARFIANSSSCTTTELSKPSISCLTAVKQHVIKYCNTIYERDGINLFWSIKFLPKSLTKDNFVLRCAYGKINFQLWTNACTNIIKRSLNITSLYLLTLFFFFFFFFSLMCVFRGKIMVKYIFCSPRLTLSLWKNGTPLCTSWFNFVHCSTCTRFKLYNNLLIR